MRTINVTVSTVSASIYCHCNSNCSEITTGHILCVLTDSVLRFPLGVCLYRHDYGGHLAFRFIFIGTALILLLGHVNVYILFSTVLGSY